MITQKEHDIKTITSILNQVRACRQALYDSDLGEEHSGLQVNADDGLYSAQGYLQTIKRRLEGYDD